MEGFIVVFFVLIALVVIPLAIVGHAKREETLKNIAKRVGGKMVDEGFLKRRHLQFEVDGVAARMTWFSGSKNHSPWTRIQFNWRPPGMLRVAPEGLFQRIGVMLGRQDIQVGDASFDGRFLIQGEPEEWVREVMGEEMRKLLLRIEERMTTWSRRGVRLDAAPIGVTLFVQNYLVNKGEETLKEFIDLGKEVFRLISSGGWKELEMGDVECSLEEGSCQVCGETLSEGNTRNCPECNTPHHQDCWEYNQGCSTFACDGR